MKISDLVRPELIRLSGNWTTKEQVIGELVDVLDVNGYLNSRDTFYTDIMDRESQITTGLSDGIAIPHARSGGVKKPAVCVGRSKNPIKWQTLDGKKVELIFLIAVPRSNENNLHLKVLSQLAVRLVDADFRQALNAAKNADEIIALLNLEGDE